MSYYIKTNSSGEAEGLPILTENLLVAFPDIDLNNNNEYVLVERSELSVGTYEVFIETVFERHGDIFKEVHKIRDMTAEEVDDKKEEFRLNVLEFNPPPASWVWNKDACRFIPPVRHPEYPNPTFGKYEWRESDTSWVIIPEKPSTGNYTLDIETGTDTARWVLE
jgi:hypothetical protein